MRDLLFRTCELPPGDRTAFLAAVCGSAADLRAEVESLLRALDRDTAFLADPTITAGSGGDGGRGVELPPQPVGSVVGPCRLLERVGEGGMGVVYRAEQDRPVRRQVAVKMIRPGLDAAAVLARFEVERQSLARMDHANVARIFTAGTTDDGRPYFVMEWVPGSPITRYCDENRLTPARRLELFVTVCGAVQHAHQKGIIHRDLKPSNILVAEVDGRAVPKVIDFGVAKALEQGADEATPSTQIGAMVGTLEYMSPEQADGAPGATDTRSDVYSLGVVLYELLTGATPLDGTTLRRVGFEQMMRILRETDPPRPSTRLSGTTEPAVGDRRQTPPRRLAQLLAGDLDAVVMKCLAKDRAARYESAAALARDVERYLAGEPVSARPQTAWYQLSKFARRHRGLAAASAAVAAVVLAGTVGTTVGLFRARAAERAEAAQRHRAEARFADVRQLASDFLFELDAALRVVAGTTPARRMLAATSLRYLDRLAADAPDDDALASELAHGYEKVGNILGGQSTSNVGDVAGALASYRKMNAILDRLARDHPTDRQIQLNRAQGLVDVGDALAVTGYTAAAAADYRRALAIATALPDGPAPDARRQVLIAYEHLGTVQSATRHWADALTSYQNALSIADARFKADPADPVAASDLCKALDDLGTRLPMAAGRADIQRSIDLAADLLRRDPANTERREGLAGSYMTLGVALSNAKSWPTALDALRHGRDLRLQLVAADPTNVSFRRFLSFCHQRIGEAEAATGDPAAAAASYAAALDLALALSEADPANVAARRELSVCYRSVGVAQLDAGRLEDGRKSLEHVLPLRLRLHSDDPGNVQAARDLASAHLDLARAAYELTVPDANAADRLTADFRTAGDELVEARAVFTAMQAGGIASPAEDELIVGIDAELRDVNGHLSALRSAAATRPAATRPSR